MSWAKRPRTRKAIEQVVGLRASSLGTEIQWRDAAPHETRGALRYFIPPHQMVRHAGLVLAECR